MALCLFRISSGNTYLHHIQEHFSLGKYTLELWWMSSRLTALNPLTLFFIYWPLCFLVTFGNRTNLRVLHPPQRSLSCCVDTLFLINLDVCCKWTYKTLPFIKTAVVIESICVDEATCDEDTVHCAVVSHCILLPHEALSQPVSEIAFSRFQR